MSQFQNEVPSDSQGEATGDERIVLDIPFKGKRTYLHSTTILTALVQRLGLTGPVKLEMRQMLHAPIEVVPIGDKTAGDKPAVEKTPTQAGTFAFMDSRERWHRYAICVDPGRAITDRVADTEAEIIANSDRQGDCLRAELGKPGNFIETLVALNKVVVAEHAGPGRKPLFSNISLDRVPDRGTVGIELRKSMGNRIFVSDALWNDTKIGSLTFMAV